RLWGSRYGSETSVRIPVPAGETAAAARDRVAEALRRRLDPFSGGMLARDVRTEGLAASRGATDFGEYFTYFSFFLVVSALLLASLFFKLGVEQRAREVGLLRAVGFTTARVARLFALEGLLLAGLGSLAGLAGAGDDPAHLRRSRQSRSHRRFFCGGLVDAARGPVRGRVRPAPRAARGDHRGITVAHRPRGPSKHRESSRAQRARDRGDRLRN